MIRVYDEIVDFIAAGATSDAVSKFQPSQLAKDYVAELIQKEKVEGLTPEESSELEHFMVFEHVMRLAKARAKMFGSQ
ncbi:MAG: hypothetical protein JWN70_1894 [Planctomycetaceae bacterium]|nr:hypothetical protein [Planctomycetaceae bacterium]